MIKELIDLIPDLQDPEEAIVLPTWSDDSAWRMVDGPLLGLSRSLAKGKLGQSALSKITGCAAV